MRQSLSSGGPAASDGESPFGQRLRHLAGLGDHHLDAIDRLCSEPRQLRARTELTHDGDRPERLHVLRSGWACRVRLLADGKRQITALLIPGDICDLDALHLYRSDFAVVTLTPCEVCSIDRAALRALKAAHPAIADALGWLGAVENAMLAERVASIGRRSARHHLAHLLCELLVRLGVVGQAEHDRFTLPITQEEIGDALGLTSVHVNRVLNGLRAEGLIEQCGRELIIRDWDALRREAGFQPGYLHLEGINGDRRDGAARQANGAEHSAARWARPADV